jgi:CelD/BcsL family acetyltransferase involved in cellulose biosynthesis
LGSSFEDYLHRHLSSKERRNFRQYKNRLERAGEWKALSFQGSEAQKMWPAFVNVERSGWKGASRSAIDHLDNRWKNYYEGFLEILVQHDALLLHFLRLNGTVIAGAFGYRIGNIFHGLKIAYDEAFRKLSPGNLLFLQLVKNLLTRHDGIRYLHMFPEDHGYKHRYANSEATCCTTLLYGRTIRGRMMYRLSQARRNLRRLPGIGPAADFIRQRQRKSF